MRTRDAGEMAERIGAILDGLAEVIATHRPEQVAIEKVGDLLYGPTEPSVAWNGSVYLVSWSATARGASSPKG